MIGWTLGGVNQTITDSGLFQSGLILQAGRKRSNKGSHIAQLTKKTIGSMQNTVRLHSNWLDGAVVGHSFRNPWSNKSDANEEDTGCTIRILLFFSFLPLK